MCVNSDAFTFTNELLRLLHCYPLLFHTVPATTEALIMSWEKLLIPC